MPIRSVRIKHPLHAASGAASTGNSHTMDPALVTVARIEAIVATVDSINSNWSSIIARNVSRGGSFSRGQTSRSANRHG